MIRLRLALAVLLFGFTLPFAQAADAPASYAEGQDYVAVPQPTTPADSKKITVEEFFWYGCPHCFRFDPQLQAWQKKQAGDVQFVRIPDSLGHEVGIVHQRAFYIAQRMGIEEKIHKPLMDALVQQHLPLESLPSIRDFFVQTAGISAASFDATASSFIVDADVSTANQLERNYQVTSVPTIVVGGKYLTNTSQPGIFDGRLSEAELYTKMLAVVDHLVEKVRAERKGGH